MKLLMRSLYMVITDPQRRCYYGAYASPDYHWGEWVVLDYNVKNPLEKLKYFRDLNAFEVSQRGEGARKEFKLERQAK